LTGFDTNKKDSTAKADSSFIPYGRQSIDESDVAEVCSVLRSDFLTQGPMVPKFEKGVCDYTAARHAVAVNSGTSALHLACRSLGLGRGDMLWTSPITFVASANCALYCGAQADFVDIDPETWNMSVTALAKKLEHAQKKKCLPKIVMPVHFSGLPCDMRSIHVLSEKYGFHIIEDACHAIGGRYMNEPVGNCKYSDITVFSFHPVKNITAGEGGMAVTDDGDLAAKMRLLRNHGITREPDEMTGEPHGQWYYQQIELGYNYRMTDIQAALGNSQLKRLDDFVACRHEIATRYDELLTDLPLRMPIRQNDTSFSGLHLYVVRLKSAEINKTHRQVFESMHEQGVGVNLHYIPIHTQPWYQKTGFKSGDFPEAEKYYNEAITLPMFPTLSEHQITEVVNALQRALS